MPLFDFPLDELRAYRPEPDEPQDFDAFWDRTSEVADRHPLDVRLTPQPGHLGLVDVWDVRFAGWNGDPINAWLIAPAGASRVGCVVTYIGYHGGRGFPHQHLRWPVAGWATLVVDTRGQGASASASSGVTGDPHGSEFGHAPGMLTKGILDPDEYYYRRVFTDAARAVDVAASLDIVDESRIVVSGHSQGGGIAQAVSALRPGVAAALVNEPFLCHFRRSCEIASTGPYPELVAFLGAQRDLEQRVFATLSYFEGMSFASRAQAPALYSVALMDTTCPPSTVFAAYNRWAGPKDIEVWPWNGHSGGEGYHAQRQLEWLSERFGTG
ncbi:acetylxylan esterase [Stackebrandtia nassauensis]|uniref:Acetyl xylan esterase n=1 Tax=Stackebrandtia nassauensis (strain DSM 44728 / CIP 108903 / NRRL B-16338 / NBRC 102104 / LLR-40K-21) TaxID=446470 RepID=D3QAK3_STANL|nr:acetylxylan esterase [Stackebrandtia nassauensis]ADD42786.1 Acetyl xylan esterase [Stackebrandtia nassauensis DSM 44728]